MFLRRWLLDAVPILGTKDIPTTILRAAIAGLCGLIIALVSVVVGKFLSCLDISDRYNPDGMTELFRVAVGITRMIDRACGVRMFCQCCPSLGYAAPNIGVHIGYDTHQPLPG